MVSRVFPDANVLYSRTLRDWLFKLSLSSGGGLFRLHWSEDVYAEVVANLRTKNPHLPGGVLASIRQHFEGAMEGGKVTDYEPSSGSPIPDKMDHHIDAAARACGAHYVITADTDFFESTVDPDLLPYEVYTADEFFMLIVDSAEDLVRAVAESEFEYRRTQHGDQITSHALADALEKAGCPMFGREVLRIMSCMPVSSRGSPTHTSSTPPHQLR